MTWLFVEARLAARRVEDDRATFLAYHVEAFARTQRLPPLEALLSKSRRHPRQRTAEEVMDVCRGLNALFGGDELPPPGPGTLED